MATEKQIEANRRNAQKSTGPKTSEGKAVIRKNAVKHGLLSGNTLLADEDSEAFMNFSERLHAQLQPDGELEELLADRISSSAWRLRRNR